jgi:hypothetical protein
MVGLIILGLAILGTITWLWAGGIEYMTKNHPDYKGEDFLNDDKKNDSWDDNKIHSEGDF